MLPDSAETGCPWQRLPERRVARVTALRESRTVPVPGRRPLRPEWRTGLRRPEWGALRLELYSGARPGLGAPVKSLRVARLEWGWALASLPARPKPLRRRRAYGGRLPTGPARQARPRSPH